jgi:hypothetical protein
VIDFLIENFSKIPLPELKKRVLEEFLMLWPAGILGNQADFSNSLKIDLKTRPADPTIP